MLRKELDIHFAGDILHHYPFRYNDRTQLNKIGNISTDGEYVQLIGTLINIFEEGTGRARRLTATLYDDTGKIELIWFQGAQWMKKTLEANKNYLVFGRVSYFNGVPNIAHPDIDPLNAETAKAGMTPVYPLTEKLKGRGVNNRVLAKITKELVSKITPADIPEILPPNIIQQYQLCDRYHAIKWIHYPLAPAGG